MGETDLLLSGGVSSVTFVVSTNWDCRALLSSPAERLVGAWRETDGERSVVEFFEDGTFSLRLKPGEIGSLENLKGKWTLLRDGRIKTEVTVAGTTQTRVGTLRVEGAQMILTAKEGTATRHDRLRQTLSPAPRAAAPLRSTGGAILPGRQVGAGRQPRGLRAAFHRPMRPCGVARIVRQEPRQFRDGCMTKSLRGPGRRTRPMQDPQMSPMSAEELQRQGFRQVIRSRPLLGVVVRHRWI